RLTRGRIEERALSGGERLAPEPAAILEVQVEPPEHAEPAHRRQVERVHLRIVDLAREGLIRPADEIRGLVRALVPGLEFDERTAGVLAGAGEARAGDEEHPRDVRTRRQDGVDMLQHLAGARERAPAGSCTSTSV